MRAALVIAAASFALAACGPKEPTANVPTAPADTGAPEAPPEPPPPQHRVNLAATQGNEAAGELVLTAMPDGVRIEGSISGLKADTEHGFHVHEKGDCSAPDASSAGEHFNPTSQPHGDPGGATHHAGDMQNIRADAEGRAPVSTVVNAVTLGDGGTNDVVGKAIVVHAKRDDYKTQPSGDSGDRIACGVIE
jgi:superoxide dismutase, Cu-Zn family